MPDTPYVCLFIFDFAVFLGICDLMHDPFLGMGISVKPHGSEHRHHILLMHKLLCIVEFYFLMHKYKEIPFLVTVAIHWFVLLLGSV